MNRSTIFSTVVVALAALASAGTSWAQDEQSATPDLIPEIKGLNVENAPLTGAVHMDRGEFAHGSILLTAQDLSMQHNATLHALSHGKVGEASEWHNPASGNSGVITPTHDYMVGHTPCRNLTVNVKAHDLNLTTPFVGCKQNGGIWTIRP